MPRRRATLVADLAGRPRRQPSPSPARYSSRSFATIDNSDPVAHTFQGFEGYFVLDARATSGSSRIWSVAAGVENLNNDRYFLFHPFPQRAFSGEIAWRW